MAVTTPSVSRMASEKHLVLDDESNATGRRGGYATPAELRCGYDDMHVEEARALCRDVVAARHDTWLTHEELRRVLHAFSLPVLPDPKALTEDQAAAVAALIGFPVVMKVSSPAIPRRAEAGAVLINLTTEAAVRSAFRQLAAKVPDALRPGTESAIVIQPMIIGIETLIRVTASPLFGRLIVFGLNVPMDVLRDLAFRVAPLTGKDAEGSTHRVPPLAFPNGHPGVPSVDVEALRDVILRISVMSGSIPEIQELALDPVIALPAGHGCRIADAKIKVGV